MENHHPENFHPHSAPPEPPEYWFPAKRYGWGWGPPCAWQGWVVLVVFFVAIAAGPFFTLPAPDPTAFLAWCTVPTIGLILVCLWKGEPPSWKWGGK